MMTTMTIRDAVVSDAEILAEAERETTKTPGLLVSQPGELTDQAFADYIVELGQHPRGKYIVACEGEILVGHALLNPLRIKSLSHVVQLTIVVHPGFTGRGIGRLMLEYLIDWAKKADGVEKIELFTRSSNARAIALYKKLGFTEEGRLIKRVKLLDGTYLDDVLMGLWVGK